MSILYLFLIFPSPWTLSLLLGPHLGPRRKGCELVPVSVRMWFRACGTEQRGAPVPSMTNRGPNEMSHGGGGGGAEGRGREAEGHVLLHAGRGQGAEPRRVLRPASWPVDRASGEAAAHTRAGELSSYWWSFERTFKDTCSDWTSGRVWFEYGSTMEKGKRGRFEV